MDESNLVTLKIERETHSRLRVYVARGRYKTNDEAISRLLENAGLPKEQESQVQNPTTATA